MKQTTQFGLNQWELSDLIQMTDFNQDNAKIDAALSDLTTRLDAAGDSSAPETKLGRTEIIKSGTLKGNVTGSTVQPSWYWNWNDWDTIGLFFFPDTSQCDENDSMQFYLSGTGAYLETYPPTGPFLALMLPWHDETREAQAIVIGGSCCVLKGSFPFSRIDNVGFKVKSPSGHLLPSAQYTFFGRR